MIVEYHRPDTIDDALKLLKRKEPVTVPLGGGTVLNAPSDDQYAVVDLQNLALSGVKKKGSNLIVGGTTTLQDLLQFPDLAEVLVKAIHHEATYNLRQVSTIAGTIVTASGRSPFATTLLALDPQLTWLPGEKSQPLGEFIPLRSEPWSGLLISQISIPLQPKLAYEYVARSPADLPIVAVAVARWASGRTRIVLGGYGDSPMMVMDGAEDDGALAVVENAYLHAGDHWASAEYRADVVKTLTKRCLDKVTD
ncbi:MAG: FAD binding domain-containing protein [Anaerolineales bacterium]|jgi:CO/xanthine dehydrogenase FAD-binding subunit